MAFRLQMQDGVVNEVELREVILAGEEEHFVFVDDVVLDGRNDRHAQEGVFPFQAAAIMLFLRGMADFVDLQLQDVGEGVGMHQHLAHGQAKLGHQVEAADEVVLEAHGPRNVDGLLDHAGVIVGFNAVLFKDVAERAHDVGIFFLLKGLDLMFLQPILDRHADGHQLVLALALAHAFDEAERNAEAVAVVVFTVGSTLEGNERGGRRFGSDFTDDGRLIVSDFRVQFVWGNGAGLEHAAENTVFIELGADLLGAVLFGFLDLPAKDFLAESGIEHFRAHGGGGVFRHVFLPLTWIQTSGCGGCRWWRHTQGHGRWRYHCRQRA